jgi:putative lipoic acid-binding regulatory protein
MTWPIAPSAETPDTLIEFPCRFPIKAMGLAGAEFEALVVEIVARHLDRLEDVEVRTRHSRGGKWVSVTLTIEARSRDQLDAIYRDLTAHESIAWVI